MASTSPEGRAKEGFPAHPFWDFSLATYARPGVADACLALQDRHGIDVNMVLFCCWLGASGRGALTPAEMAAALDMAGPWQRNVVVPLRRIRRDLDGSEEAIGILKRRVAAVEIDAEHAEHLLIAVTVTRPSDASKGETKRVGDACANLGRYLAALGIAPGAPDRADLAAVLSGTFPRQSHRDMDARVKKGFYGLT